MISGQKFITLDTGPIAEVRSSSWLDPRDMTEAGPSAVSTPPVTSSAPVPRPVEAAAPVQSKPLSPAPMKLRPMNTPNQGARMIGGGPVPPPTPPKDPWAAPVPSPATKAEPNQVIVEPGAKIKLGGGV